MEEWIALVKKEGPKDEKSGASAEDQTQDGTNSAWWIAERAEGKGGDERHAGSVFEGRSSVVEGSTAGPKENYGRFTMNCWRWANRWVVT